MLQNTEQPSYEGEIFTYTKSDWQNGIWILTYQWKIVAGYRILHYSYSNPQGEELYSGSDASIDEEALFPMFHLWVFYNVSKLFEVKFETVLEAVEKKVVKQSKASVPVAKNGNGTKAKAN